MARVYEALMLARSSCPKTEEFLGAFDFGETVEEAARESAACSLSAEAAFPPLPDVDAGEPLPFPTTDARMQAVAFEAALSVNAEAEMRGANFADIPTANGGQNEMSGAVADEAPAFVGTFVAPESAVIEPASAAADALAPVGEEVGLDVAIEEPVENGFEFADSSPASVAADQVIKAAVESAAAECLAESDDVDLDGGEDVSAAQATGLVAVESRAAARAAIPLSQPAAVPTLETTSTPGLVPAPWREEFAQLAGVIKQARESQRLQVLAVCGAARGDGASFVAHNLSLAMAEGSALRVARFEIRESSRAWPETVRHNTDEHFQIAIRRTPVANVSEITTLHGGVTLAQLLRGCDTSVLLDMLRKRFDVVLLDLPAVTVEGEAAQLAAQADGVMIVAQQEGERRSPIAQARMLLAEANANILGVVLNHRREGDGADVRQVA